MAAMTELETPQRPSPNVWKRIENLVQAQRTHTAVLAGEKSDTHVLVTFDPRSEQLTLKRVGDFQENADKSLQLWALPAAQTGQVVAGPRSLGVLGREKWVHLAALENQINGVPALAISL
jgi:anti-sigma-K factor RskA